MAERIIFETRSGDTTVRLHENVERHRNQPLFDIGVALSKGEVIHNDQIEAALEVTKKALEEEANNPELEEHGQYLVRDVEELLSAMENLLLQKNKDEKLQMLFKEVKESTAHRKEAMKGKMERVAERTADEIKADAKEIYEAVKDLIISLIKSDELRGIIGDLLDLVKSLLAEGKAVQGSSPEAKEPATVPTWLEIHKEEMAEESKSAVEDVVEEGKSWREVVVEGEKAEEAPEAPVEGVVKEEEALRRSISAELEDKFLHLLTRLGGTVDYQKVVQNFFRICGSLKKSVKEVGREIKRTSEQDHAERALEQARSFIEGFTGRRELDKFLKSLNAFWEEVVKDDEMQSFLEDLKETVLDGVFNPEALGTQKKKAEVKDLAERGEILLSKPEYRRNVNKIIERGKILLENVKEDKETKNLQKKVDKFLKDFAFDAHGRPDIWVMDDSFHQLKHLLLPIVQKHLESVPIDYIEVMSPNLDATIENLIFSAETLLPDCVRLKVKHDTDVEMKEVSVGSSVTKIKLEMLNIRPHFRNIKFSYRKKTFPKFEDCGVADVDFEGDGVSLFITWNIERGSHVPPIAELSKVKCTVDKLSIGIKDSRHNVVEKLITKLMINRIRRQIASSISNGLGTSLTKVNDQINALMEQRSLFGKLKTKANEQMQKAYDTMKSH